MAPVKRGVAGAGMGEERKVSGHTEALITVYSSRVGRGERGTVSLMVLIRAVQQAMFLDSRLI